MQQMTVQQLDARLRGPETEMGPKPLVLDVREPWELGRAALPDVLHIPMREIPARLAEIDTTRDIAVLCHHGNRSNHVARFLDAQGFKNVYNVMGGIEAWARDVDPQVGRY